MSNPRIRIKASFLLNNAVVPLLQPQLAELGRSQEAEPAYINAKVHEYTASWESYEAKILTGLQDALGVSFEQNIIDVYIAPFNHSFSDPMVISTKHTGDRFIDVLTHEISHRLLTDNNKFQFQTANRRLSDHWAELFGANHSFGTLVHIPVHALLEHVFINVLNEPKRVQRDKELMQRHPDYDAAWQYVSSTGYAKTIDQLKTLYARLDVAQP